MQTIQANTVSQVIQPRPSHSHKGTYGRVTLIGGNEHYGGAIILASQAAVATGAGLVTTITHPCNHSALHSRVPEVMVSDWFDWQTTTTLINQSDVLVIGPGLGLEEQSRTLFQQVLAWPTLPKTLIIDGSALTLLAEHDVELPHSETNCLLTPHEKEWERLSGLSIPEQTPENNQRYQQQLGATVILKKHRTEIYSAEEPWLNPLGTPAMATGGMGDTLAGMLAGFTAQFPATLETSLAAVYLHSYIAENLAKTQYVVLPTQLIAAISSTMKQFEMNRTATE